MQAAITRRALLKSGLAVGAGLTIGFELPRRTAPAPSPRARECSRRASG
jgi:hypothetical protein